MTAHRDGCKRVAALANQAPQSLTLGSQHNCGWLRKIDRVIRRWRVGCQPNGPHPQVFQLLQRPSDVHDLGDLHVRDCACRRFRRDPRAGSGSPCLNNDTGRAGRVRGSEDRTKVMRIFDPVQDHDQWRARGTTHKFIETVISGIVDVRHDSLMDTSTRSAREQIGSNVLRLDAVCGGEGKQVAHPIIATLGNPQLLHASRAESLDDWIDAVDDHLLRVASKSTAPVMIRDPKPLRTPSLVLRHREWT
jgi:hypothetical protein